MSVFADAIGRMSHCICRNPLGVIGLFIVLVVGIASYVLTGGAESITGAQSAVLISFVTGFPVVVFVVFVWLVVKHHEKLYGPMDFRGDSAFLSTVNPRVRDARIAGEFESLRAEIRAREPIVGGDKVGEDKIEAEAPVDEKEQPKPPVTEARPRALHVGEVPEKQEYEARIRKAEELALKALGKELGQQLSRNVQVGAPGFYQPFDAVSVEPGRLTMVEVRAFLHERASAAVLPDIFLRAEMAAQTARTAGGPQSYRLILAVVLDVSPARGDEIRWQIASMLEHRQIPVEVKYYDIGELEGGRGTA